jgi:aryl-alcohol dehydrogenase-like predicted oxidoreductase
MLFGTDMGADEETSRRIFDAYVDQGGNVIDTAGVYGAGRSESLIGAFAKGKRDRLVLSTKYSLTFATGDPNAAGNNRKNMARSVEDSLKRLGTDYIDLLFLHAWDDTTPPDEILRGFDDLIRQGKVLYIGLSDTPAWQTARMQVMAELRGWSQFAAMQLEYSLLERTSERELIPAARGLGFGVMPWGPLRAGVLSGKYTKSTEGISARLKALDPTRQPSEDTMRVAQGVQAVADKMGATSAQVALAWTLANPAVVSPITGPRTLAQLEDSIGALKLELSTEHLQRLNDLSQIEPGFPYSLIHSKGVRATLSGRTKLRPRRDA